MIQPVGWFVAGPRVLLSPGAMVFVTTLVVLRVTFRLTDTDGRNWVPVLPDLVSVKTRGWWTTHQQSAPQERSGNVSPPP